MHGGHPSLVFVSHTRPVHRPRHSCACKRGNRTHDIALIDTMGRLPHTLSGRAAALRRVQLLLRRSVHAAPHAACVQPGGGPSAALSCATATAGVSAPNLTRGAGAALCSNLCLQGTGTAAMAAVSRVNTKKRDPPPACTPAGRVPGMLLLRTLTVGDGESQMRPHAQAHTIAPRPGCWLD